MKPLTTTCWWWWWWWRQRWKIWWRWQWRTICRPLVRLIRWTPPSPPINHQRRKSKMAKIGETQNIHNRNIQAESWCICTKTLKWQYGDNWRIFWEYSIPIFFIGKRHDMWPLLKRSRSLCFLEWKVILSKFEPLFALALFLLSVFYGHTKSRRAALGVLCSCKREI